MSARPAHSWRVVVVAIAASALLAPAAPAAAPPGEYPWGERVASAQRYAEQRLGKVSIGVVDPERRFHGHHANRRYNSASTVKVMLLVAYLRHGSNNREPLTRADRDLLGPMISRSDNEAATRVRDIVGNDALVRVASRAGMKRFETNDVWGLCKVTARDQARWMFEIERQVPPRHRHYAMRLLTRIIPRQRWGIPPEAPRGWEIHFKGGWAPSGYPGWTVNQVARLERRGERFSIAILTRQSPSKAYGIETIRGVADRLLKRFARFEP